MFVIDPVIKKFSIFRLDADVARDFGDYMSDEDNSKSIVRFFDCHRFNLNEC